MLLVNAQPASLSFEHLSFNEGLSDHSILALERDRLGFLWVGTQRGLNRYDGVRTLIHTKRSTDGRLKSDLIYEIEEDPDLPGVIWIGTGAGGLVKYLPESNSFLDFPVPGAEEANIRDIAFDGSGHLWIGTSNAGIYQLHRETGVVLNHLDADLFSQQPGGSIFALLVPSLNEQTLWIGTSNGLAILDLNTYNLASVLDVGNQSILSLAETSSHVWAGSSLENVYQIDPIDLSIVKAHNFASNGAISSIEPSTYYSDRVWIGTRAGGVFLVDGRGETGTARFYHSNSTSSLSQDDVLTVLEDRQQILWVGTAIGGLNKSLVPPPRFAPSIQDLSAPFRIKTERTLTVYESDKGSNLIWYSVPRKGLHKFDRLSGGIQHVPTNLDDNNLLFMDLYEDHHGEFWVGANREVLYRFDVQTNRLNPVDIGELKENALVRQFYISPSNPNYMWISTRKMGLLLFDLEQRKKLKHFGQDEGSAMDLGVDDIWQVYEPKNNPDILWVATQGGGLRRIDIKKGVVEFWSSDSNRDCFHSDNILSVNGTADGTLWLGVSEVGLVNFDPETEECSIYSIEHGLAHPDVGAILVDNRSRVWASTQNGLSNIDPNTGSITTFTTDQGLQGNEFIYHAYHQTASGFIVVGGSNGFNRFHPDSIAIDLTPPHVTLTGIRVDGIKRPVVKKQNGEYEQLTLKSNERDVEFFFASLDLRQPHINKYMIKVEGTDNDWVLLGTQSSERYTKLSYGANVLRLRGTNRDGLWAESSDTLRVFVNKPVWMTLWFWFTIALVIGSIISGGNNYRLRQQKKLQDMRQGIADDLHDDIGGKMIEISSQADAILMFLEDPEKSQELLQDIADTSRSVMDDLKDSIWIVDSAYDSLGSLISRMKKIAYKLYSERNTQFTVVNVDEAQLMNMERRRNLLLFFKECLNNMVKHSQATKVDIHLEGSGDYMLLKMIDNGNGFDMKNAERGRGMKTLQRRADALEGSILLKAR